MGYNAEIIGADFILPAEHFDAALTALKELNQHNELKSGGAWGTRPDGSYGQIAWYFAWMDEDYDQRATSVGQVLEWLGFEINTSDEGLEIWGYDSNVGDERHFIEALAPFIKPGSYLEWEGEDRESWRWDFDGETMTERTGRVVWE